MTTNLLTIVQSNASLIMQGLVLTLHITLIAMTVGFVVGTVFGVVSARTCRRMALGLLIESYVWLVRGTPVYLQVLIFYYALPDLLGINLSPLIAGSLALGCNSIAYIAEIVRSGINAIPVGQWEAGHVLGYSKVGALVYIIMPQMFKNCIGVMTSEITTLLKETSILGTIGLLELTKVGTNINARFLQPMPIYLTIGLFYLVLTTMISVVTKKIEQRLQYD